MSKIASYKLLFEKRLFFRFLLEYNKAGIYALVNQKHKKIFIQAAADIVHHLGHNVSLLARKQHLNKQLVLDRKYLSIKLLEQCKSSHKDIMKMKWIDHYRQLGYSIYNTENMPLYRVRKTVVHDVNEGFIMAVQLVSKGNRVTTVALFDNEVTADTYIKDNSVYMMLMQTKK